MATAPLPLRGRRLLPALALGLAALLALGTDGVAQAPPSPKFGLSVPGGPAGSDVTVRVTGLTPGLRLQVGFGGLATNHEILAAGEADSEGVFQFVTKIPEWVERHRTYYFFVAYAGQPPRATSDPFIATAADGFMRVAGRVSATSNGCVQVTGFDDTVYTLLGETGSLQTGARVVVEGTVGAAGEGSVGGCGTGSGIPVRVRQVLPG